MSREKVAHLRQESNTLMILNLDDPRVRDNLPDEHWWLTAEAIARGHEMERKWGLAHAGHLDISELEEF